MDSLTLPRISPPLRCWAPLNSRPVLNGLTSPRLAFANTSSPHSHLSPTRRTETQKQRMRKMLGGLLGGRAFSSKCKSAIKRIACRIELVVRRKKAVIKFLKKDIADLLHGGFDTTAYNRVEGLKKETEIISCYYLLDQYCGCLLEQLPAVEKKKECPKEIEEAVSTLIYASARFADLPELRDLRHRLKEKFGDNMESSVNKEFIEKMSWKPLSIDQKLKLLQEISEEFSINWDPKALSEIVADANPLAWNTPKQCNTSLIDQDASPEENDEPALHAWSDTDPDVETDTPIAASNGQKQILLDHDDSMSSPNPDIPASTPPTPYLRLRVKEIATFFERPKADSSPRHHLKPKVEDGGNEDSVSDSVQEAETPVSDGSPYAFEKVDDNPASAKPKPRSVRRNLRRRVQEIDSSTESDSPLTPRA